MFLGIQRLNLPVQRTKSDKRAPLKMSSLTPNPIPIKRHYFKLWYHKARHHAFQSVREAKADLFYSVMQKRREERLLERLFRKWVLETKLRLEWRMQQDLARLFHESAVMRRYFCVWKRLWHEARVERQIEAMAVKHHERSLQQRAFGAWGEYIEARKGGMLHAVFRAWRHVSLLRRLEHHFVQQREKFLCFRHFQHWKRQHALHRMERELELYQRDKLLAECFHHWRDALRWKVEHQHRLQIAHNFCSHKLMQRALRALQLHAHFQITRRRHQRAVLFKHFAHWHHVAHLSHFWSELTQMATKHYELQLQQKMLTAWSQYVRHSHEHQTKLAYALYHYETRFRERMMRQCFAAWKQYHLHKQQDHFDEVKAELFVAYRFFRRWQQAYQAQLALKDEMANCHSSLALLKRGFAAFKQYIHQRRLKNRIKMHADTIYHEHLKRRHFEIWLLSWRIREQEVRIADNFYDALVLKHGFQQFLRAYEAKLQQDNELVREFRAKWSQELLYQTFFTWRLLSNQNLRAQHEKTRADLFRREKLLSRHFRRWNHLVVRREMLSISELLSEASMLDLDDTSSFLTQHSARGRHGYSDRMSESQISAYDPMSGVQVSSIIALNDPFL